MIDARARPSPPTPDAAGKFLRTVLQKSKLDIYCRRALFFKQTRNTLPKQTIVCRHQMALPTHAAAAILENGHLLAPSVNWVTVINEMSIYLLNDRDKSQVNCVYKLDVR